MSDKTIWVRIAKGAAWGACMIVSSFFLGAAGHGVFIPLLLFAAPASLFGTFASWLLSIPVGALLAATSQNRGFPWLAGLHYLTGAVAVASEPSDLESLPTLPASFAILFIFNMLLYVGGHVWLWRGWLRSQKALIA